MRASELAVPLPGTAASYPANGPPEQAFASKRLSRRCLRLLRLSGTLALDRIRTSRFQSKPSRRQPSLRRCSSLCRSFRLGAVVRSVMPCHVITGQDHARQCPRPMPAYSTCQPRAQKLGPCQPDGILGTGARLARVIPTCLKCAGCLDGVSVYHEADPRES